ncbi:hypothetical protein UCRPA7_4818 [Phaeoacremonium minimum UCRPA7]|uniref:Endo-1,3(4)-beta-glucanase n=1 Tax=Phaeoacremonium minimum (strain UCR-PA7) TaxID=1286976 RepID=R8BJY3_PHAM7|nr:hypothetical protein UCRPA7_4818 [Phaeoacremonium minimum UCRPA7]EON99630.1 hypothetical protein UCRPA7_4818 [Phaeoacremonium minimum UCRPA7]
MLKPNLVLALIWLFVPFSLGQGDTLGLRNGYTKLQTANFDIQLVHDAQVLASLRPLGQTFDFLPSDYLSQRAGNGQYHWGDITFRYRSAGSTAWINGDSAASRHAVSAVPSNESLAASNLKPTLPSGIALNVTREWLDVEGDLGLTFTVLNSGTTALEIGSLGFPAEFNSIFTNRTAEEAQAKCSLSDPYIGMHGGFIRVSRLNGENPALVVTPLGDTPLEAYRNLDEPYYDATAYESQTFEGFYEWQMLTKAWAEKEWNNTDPWNQPSSRILQPGKSLKAGLRFSIAKNGIRAIEDTVQSTGTPYARCVPGYIIPQDMPAQLLVRPGPGAEVAGFSAEPAGSLKTSEGSNGVYKITPSASSFGRARLTITYSDNKIQTVHYFITKPAPDTIKGLGQFLTTKQYFTNTSDPFGRAPSVMTYDYDVKAIVTQDDRVWIAGLSDEAGAGSFLAAAMKQAAQPDAEEITKLEAFVSKVMWGHIQTSNYAVRKSIFYYDQAALPNYTYSPSIDWTGWQSWNKQAAYSTDRAYDYVHVAASYWAMYRAARAYPQLFKEHDWAWYLNQSYSTVMACMATDSSGNPTVGYSRVGLMGETVFGELLKDLGREGLAEEAESLEEKMRVRAALWDTEPVPFGSEMAWDSTGQEGVYYWSKYFGYNDTALKALGTVLGFQPTVPHWGWNGNARRYWDNMLVLPVGS